MNNFLFQNYNYLDSGYLDIVIDANFPDDVKDNYDCPLIYVTCQNGEIVEYILCDEGYETKFKFSENDKYNIEAYINSQWLLENADWSKSK